MDAEGNPPERGEPEKDAPAQGEAVAPLRGLLELFQLTRRQPTLDETLHAVAPIVARATGFQTTVVNIYRPQNDEYEVVAVHGSQRAKEALLGQVGAAETWTSMLDERFHHHGVYFIPAGAIEYDQDVVWYVPDLPGTPADERSWHADDALFAMLNGPGGRRYGIISFDDPVSGLRPLDHELEMLGALAANASLAIESSIQMAALEAALDRNRAVIESALDGVIAIDRHDRVLEFNPAAEQLFGYARHEIVGQPAMELLVPPDEHETYRRVAASLRAEDSTLLGRRMETTAMHRDRHTFPVELTVTRVAAGEHEEPIFYGFVRDISERRRGEEQLAFLAYHDGLTGLPNRIMVEQQVETALARARRGGGATALMFVDLDDFKEVNDRLGHHAGDQLLTAVATRLRSVLRSSDVLARQGGDEFLVLLSDLGDEAAAAAERVGTKLLSALREPFIVAGSETRTTASIGVSLFPADAEDTETLLRHADGAMYEAKAAGGGRVIFHHPYESRGSPRTSISSQLHAAIAAGELELHYQPVWSIGHSPRRLRGAETLLRWRHPERGLLTPEAFISQTDQTSAGDALMEWVIAAACRQAAAWKREGLPMRSGLNVSSHQLTTPGFVDRFLAEVRGHDLDPTDFVVELTESAWTVDAAGTMHVIRQLRREGLLMALDNFGAGYTSLSRLLDLGFDMIKVDRRMLRNVPVDPGAVKLLLAVFELVSACGSIMVATGVETEEQGQFLRTNGVRMAQGDHLGRPMPASELTLLLQELTGR